MIHVTHLNLLFLNTVAPRYPGSVVILPSVTLQPGGQGALLYGGRSAYGQYEYLYGRSLSGHFCSLRRRRRFVCQCSATCTALYLSTGTLTLWIVGLGRFNLAYRYRIILNIRESR